jgi:hypothetical protein
MVYEDRTMDFSGEKKILSAPSFGGEVKPSVPCRSFAACKKFLSITVEVAIVSQIQSAISRP